MTDEKMNISAALAMAAGQDMKQFFDLQIDADDKRILHKALENIFQGTSVILWVNGGTLGDAWNAALDKMRDEFFATSRRDTLTIFLQRAVFEHRNKWFEKIRNNDNRLQTFSILNLSAGDTDKMVAQAKFQKQQGYDTIKQMFEKYDSGFKPTPKPQPVAEHIVTRERVHEREERVRERVK